MSADTPHPDASAMDSVACINCGAETPPDDAVAVAMGLYTYTCDGMKICTARHTGYEKTATMCATCADDVLNFGPEHRRTPREFAVELPNRPRTRTGSACSTGPPWSPSSSASS